jgi:hypothetical protein
LKQVLPTLVVVISATLVAAFFSVKARTQTSLSIHQSLPECSKMRR